MFSPYYAAQRRKGLADPEQHCAINVALYGAKGGWAMTERGAASLRRDANALQIGPSSLRWQGDDLVIDLDEITVPVPSRIRGRIVVRAPILAHCQFALDDAGQHHWTAIAPTARIEVQLEKPGLSWAGAAYFDSNRGTAPLESAFRSWTWSRAALDSGCAVFYDVAQRNGSSRSLALKFDATGQASACHAPPEADLPKSGWRVARSTHSDAGFAPKVMATLEDAPFYARSMVSASVNGTAVTAVHESLNLDRFQSRLVQCMLPFRMPRRAGRKP